MSEYSDYVAKRSEQQKATNLGDYSEWIRSVPLLASGLTEPIPRSNGRCVISLTLFFEDGRFKVCFTDRKDGMVAFLTLESPDTFFDECNRSMLDGSLEWRKGGRK